MEWIAFKHALMAHLPVATGLLLPWALLSSQRVGRGIRPWWTVARYLGWAGLLGLLAATVSGLAAGRMHGLIPPTRYFPTPAMGMGPDAALFRHVVLAVATLPLAVAALWAMNRFRKDHQNLGMLALLLGLGWCAALLAAGQTGYSLAHARRPTVQAAVSAAPMGVPVPVVHAPADPEALAPLRALDFAALEAIRAEPVKSPVHGGRWIRAWANPAAASAYRAGRTLPLDSLVVLSTLEDRWSQPGTEPGPLYVLEMNASGPSLTFYWPRVPVNRLRETGGQTRAYWRGQDTHLESCRACHATGMADPAKRSRWRVPKKVVPAE